MKKLIYVLLAVLVCLSMVGCTKETEQTRELESPEIQDEAVTDNSAENTEVQVTEAAVDEETVTEAAPEEVQVVTSNAEVYNNGGHFTGYNDWVCFIRPDDESMQQSALFANFMNSPSGMTTIMAYNPKTEEIKEIISGYFYGRIWFSGTNLFINRVDEKTNETELLIYDFEAGEVKDTLRGFSVSGGDDEGRDVVAIGYAEGGSNILVFRDGEQIRSLSNEGYSECVAVAEGYVVRTQYDDANDKCYLTSYDIENESTCNLGDVPSRETEGFGGTAEFFQSCIKDGRLYVSLCWYEGTGHFLAEQAFMTADLATENSVVKIETIMPSYESTVMEEFFVVKNGEMLRADGVPGKGFINEDTGEYGYIDEEGKFIVNGTGFEYVIGDNGLTFSNDGIDLVKDKLFMINNNLVRKPEDDIGWREAYVRAFCSIFCETVGTGDGHNIESYTNPMFVEGD